MNPFELSLVITAIDRATAPIAGVTQELSEVTTEAASLGDTLQSVGQSAMMLGTAMTVAGGVIVGSLAVGLQSVLEPAREVQDSLAKVASVVTPLTGTVEDASKRMRTAALDWSTVHTDTASKFLDTTYMMISAGLDEVAAVEATRSAMLTAKATMGEGASAAALLATIYNNMGDKTKDAAAELAHLGDVVTKTQQTFQFANLDQLNEGLKFGIPTALQYGIGIEELSAIIGQFNNAGLAGAMAGTAFSASMAAMQGASEKLKFSIARTADGGVDFIGTVKNIEKQFGSLKDFSPEVMASFQEAFGGEGWRGLSLMVGKSDELAANLAKVKDNTGAAAAAAAVLEGTDTALFEKLKNRIAAFQVGIADRLQPALGNLKTRFIEVIAAVGKWLEQNPEVINVFIDAVSELANTVAGFLPYVMKAVQAVGGWIKENPELTRTIFKVVAALGAIMAIAGPIIVAVGAVAAGIAGLIAAKGVILVIVGVASQLALLAFWATIVVLGWRKLKAVTIATWDAIASFVTASWGRIAGTATGLWGRITGAVGAAWAAITERLGALWAAVTSGVAAAWNTIAGLATSLWSSVTSALASAWNGITAKLSSLWGEVVAAFEQNFWLGIMTLLKNFHPAVIIARAWLAVAAAAPGFIASLAEVVVGALIAFIGRAKTVIVSGFTAAVAWMVSSWNSIAAAVPVAWAAIVAAVSLGVESTKTAIVSGFTAAVAWVVSSWNTIVAAVPVAWAAIVAAVSLGVESTKTAIVSGFTAAVAWVVSSWNSIVAAVPVAWAAIVAGVQAGIAGLLTVLSYLSPLPAFQTAFQSVLDYFASFSLVESGMRLVETLTEGIKAAASAPVDAVREMVGNVRDLLPFSPAKTGPLSDLDRIQLVETIAKTVRPAPLVEAMSGAAGAAVAALPVAVAEARVNTRPLPSELATTMPAPSAPLTVPVMPEIVWPPLFSMPPLASTMPVAPSIPQIVPLPMVPPRGRDDSDSRDLDRGPAPSGQPLFQVIVQGNATADTVQQLEKMLRDNAGLIVDIVNRERQRESRTELGRR